MLLTTLPDNRTLGIAFQHLEHKPEQEVPLKGGGHATSSSRCTYCTLYLIVGEDATFVAEGVSRCNPLDHFYKEIGRKLALKKALEAWGCPAPVRMWVWDAYHSRKPTTNKHLLTDIKLLVAEAEAYLANTTSTLEGVEMDTYDKIRGLLGYPSRTTPSLQEPPHVP